MAIVERAATRPGKHAARPVLSAPRRPAEGGRWPAYVPPVGAEAPGIARSGPPWRPGTLAWPAPRRRLTPAAAAHPLGYAVAGLVIGWSVVGGIAALVWLLLG